MYFNFDTHFLFVCLFVLVVREQVGIIKQDSVFLQKYASYELHAKFGA